MVTTSSYPRKFTHADLDIARLESPESTYLTGWSLGKEKLKNDRPDTLKGSYYINCAFHADQSLECSPTAPTHANGSQKTYATFPEYTTPNIWPREAVLPGFKQTATELCNLIIDTATLVARACDRFALENVPDYEAGYLERMVQESMTTKARLLHYFPPPASNGSSAGDKMQEDDDWCATHLDHGCLTGLTSAMYVDEALAFPTSDPSKPTITPTSTDEGGANAPLPLPELDSPPDPRAGLYIQSRKGDVVKVAIPRDCLAFQTGEALEVITKGRFRAVPHFVRGMSGDVEGSRSVARNTLAVFTQPNLWSVVDREEGVDFAGFARSVVERNY